MDTQMLKTSSLLFFALCISPSLFPSLSPPSLSITHRKRVIVHTYMCTSLSIWVYVWLWVKERQRKWKRETKRERERERDGSLSLHLSVDMCACKCEIETYKRKTGWDRDINRQRQSGNLLSFLLRCGTKPYEWSTQWDSNSLV